MPPVGGKAKSKGSSREGRQSRSRNTTPISNNGNGVTASTENGTTAYLHTPLSHLLVPPNVSLEDIMGSGNGGSAIPTATDLNNMADRIKKEVINHIKLRSDACDKGMRQLAEKRKERAQMERERASREDEERRHKEKKLIKKTEKGEDRPLAVGAHGVARQDGIDVHKEASSSLSPTSSPSSAPLAAAKAETTNDAGSRSSSEEPRQPPPAPPVQQFPTFGPDPTKFDDPTIYHIRPIQETMSEAEKKNIYSVSHYPPSDLHDLTCGTPPDKDFSNAKPQNQTAFDSFLKYQEPYTRPLTEEDLAFLKERGDRIQPFIMPRRGARNYRDIWSEEDGAMVTDGTEPPKQSQNEARGSADDITDEILGTNDISAGPMLSRLLQAIIPQPLDNPNPSSGDSLTAPNGDNADGENDSHPPLTTDETNRPATFLPEFSQPGYKPPAPASLTTPDYSEMDGRLKLELQHIGFLPPASSNPTPADFDAHFDDEVAARLRFLQNELRTVSQINGARKARILELTEERMAQQEYSTIADDLDNQLNQAYLKRNRNIGKGGKAKNKRPGAGGSGGGSTSGAAGGAAGAGGGQQAGVSRPAVGDSIRGLMERKSQFNSIIGPVVNHGMNGIPKETIFDEESMRRLMGKEMEMWNEVEE
ncbi:MAG: Transcriptional regulator [Bogoriella megaspora]|nr:MAG: Transcriptional regulator [Bogoriella megaspora]